MSCGKGNRFCTNSSKVIPVDQTSDRILYVSPARRSGYIRMSLEKYTYVIHYRTYRHVETSASEGTSVGVDEFTGHTEIT